jgi:hypothetical protein
MAASPRHPNGITRKDLRRAADEKVPAAELTRSFGRHVKPSERELVMTNFRLARTGVAAWGWFLLLAPAVGASEANSTDDSWPGKRSSFHSFAQYDFKLEGIDFKVDDVKIESINCKVVVPDKIADGKPWIWRATYWDHEPQTEIALLMRGFHVVHVGTRSVKLWDTFYKYLTESHGFDKKAVLEGMSIGGRRIYQWGANNPEKVHCMYADAQYVHTRGSRTSI